MILGFDTSGGWVDVALHGGGQTLARHHAQMAKGQAEALVPMIDATLSDAGATKSDLTAIGVGTGPGNFTGIRIAIATARGMALALGIPAIGITTFQALYGTRTDKALVALPAPRDQVYAQAFGTGDDTPCLLPHDHPRLSAATDVTLITLPDPHPPLPDPLARLGPEPGAPLAPAIAQIAATRAPSAYRAARPRPLYLKPADAAPSRTQSPVIL